MRILGSIPPLAFVVMSLDNKSLSTHYTGIDTPRGIESYRHFHYSIGVSWCSKWMRIQILSGIWICHRSCLDGECQLLFRWYCLLFAGVAKTMVQQWVKKSIHILWREPPGFPVFRPRPKQFKLGPPFVDVAGPRPSSWPSACSIASWDWTRPSWLGGLPWQISAQKIPDSWWFIYLLIRNLSAKWTCNTIFFHFGNCEVNSPKKVRTPWSW